jgi:hypothetical protein
MSNDFEKVYTITDWYDGPREGIADFNGSPHIYMTLFEPVNDDWSDILLLAPVDEETFQLALEHWEIWKRWERAFYEKRVAQTSPMVLPEDEQRFEELQKLLEGKLRIHTSNAIEVRAEFRSGKSIGTEVGRWQYEVKWTEVKDDESLAFPEDNIQIMSKQQDDDILEQRRTLALQMLRDFVKFAQFEKWKMPYEFLSTMEGLVAIIKKPDWLLLHDENGRYKTSEESAEYMRRLYAVWEIAMKGDDATTIDQKDVVARYCHYCESIILSNEATLCLWCGEQIVEQSNKEA